MGRRMNERKIRQLFLEHVQELAGDDTLQVYIDFHHFGTTNFTENECYSMCQIIGSFLLSFSAMQKIVNYIQFCEGPWIMVELTEETKEMRKHNANWLVDYVEGMEKK